MDSTLVDGDTESRLAAGDPRVKSMLQISDSHMEEWESFWLTDTNGKETQMGKRQKWKRVVLVKRHSSSKNSSTIYCACPITVYVNSSWLCNKWKDGTRASRARVLSQYLIPLFHASVPRWIKKNDTRAHQAWVPQKVVDCYIVRKQCFWAKYFQN